MKKQGSLVVVSGFSGAGKGTLIKALLSRYDNYVFSVSATTRSPREGEVEGSSYFFVTNQQFEQMIQEDALIEYAQYVNHYYGTPKDYILEQTARGKDVILDIEIQGALNIKKKFPQALLLFITPPDARELKRRLVGRGTESQEVIEARLLRAVTEADEIKSYDYLLINDEIDVCVEQMHQLIQANHRAVILNTEFIDNLKEELSHI